MHPWRLFLLLLLVALAAPAVALAGGPYKPGDVVDSWAYGCHSYRSDGGRMIYIAPCAPTPEPTPEPTRETTTEETTRETTQETRPAPVSESPPIAPPPTPLPEPTPTPGTAPEPPSQRVWWNGQFMDMDDFLCFQDRARNPFTDTLESTGC